MIRLAGALALGAILSTGPWSEAWSAQAVDGQLPTPAAGESPRNQLFGEMGGLRPALSRHGLTLDLQEISEVLAHAVTGDTAAHYEGVTVMGLGLDTSRAFRWPGGMLRISALQIHCSSCDAVAINSFQHESGIEAAPTTRLWELWYEQSLAGGRADLRIGQQSIDQELIASEYSSMFVNMMMGWPMLTSADLYGGGPAYPLSSLGVRLRLDIAPTWTLLAGVFDDNPPGGPFADDSQLRGSEASGTRLNLGTGALWITELQYASHASATGDCGSLACGLPGTYKLGAWYDTAGFPDQRFDRAGMSLADPAGSHVPRTDRGNYSLYMVLDQLVWRELHGPRSIGVFARLMGAPSDRNLMDYSLNAGVVVNAPLAGRGVLGIGYGWTHVSESASGLNRDTERFTGEAVFVRSAERFIEVTYQYPVTRWWQLQPDLQYLENPGGGVPAPHDTARWLGREFIFGLRTTITF